ncbi:PilZ domain-containing protein [Desulfobulbus elongatus]|uniref:PilZ domain-containing protein n=1 Tax=Desulfobulbus elongatus TaxID=53332 RepID=UPI000480FBBD
MDIRVIFTRSVKVYSQGKLQGQFPVRNLSLGGLFVEGAPDLPVGQDCRLELHETGRRSSLILTFSGMVRRREEDGVGICFTGMEDDSFMFLQTMILYSSDDPMGVAEHFLEHFVPKSFSAC